MRQVFRSTTAMVVGWIWMAFAAFNAVDLAVRYNGQASMIAAAVLGVLTTLVFVACLRPAVILTEEGVLVRNPLRNAFLPWREVEGATVSHSITITAGGRTVRCWAPQTSARERAAAARRGAAAPQRGRFRTEPVRSRGEQAAAEALAGKTHADWVAEQITERAEAARRLTRHAEAGAPAVSGTDTSAVSGTDTPAASETGGGTAGISWSPSALAALAAAAVLVVAAFLA
ncbi:PH domain-containing protein [Streptosporangium fragile]